MSTSANPLDQVSDADLNSMSPDEIRDLCVRVQAHRARSRTFVETLLRTSAALNTLANDLLDAAVEEAGR